MKYSVKLETFEGPFDLLYYLIEQAEIDIYDIPISDITDQYLDYIAEMKTRDLNVTSEFILMAATLIEIKSKLLLPSKVKEEDPRLMLVDQLLEYKRCKEASEKLKIYEENAKLLMSKRKEEFIFEGINKNQQLSISDIDIAELYNTFLKLMKKEDFEDEIEIKREKFVYRESFKVTDCVEDILKRLESRETLSIYSLFREHKDISNFKEYVVTVFLALLELSKKKDLAVKQDRSFGDIEIYKLESLNE